jgi:AraC family transcriptional regulator
VNVFFRAAAFAHGELDADLCEFGRLPLENVFVPGATAVIRELVTELENPTRFSAEAADSLARLLLIRTARSTSPRLRARPALSRHAERQLRDYVLEHLSERILVADLAEVVGVSPNRFAHVFSASTGRSPHQFVIGLRLEMAQDLLCHSRLGLAEIAATCGFSSQQHMTATMRQHCGITPGKGRKQGPRPLTRSQ